jgi:L-serine dehydratase
MVNFISVQELIDEANRLNTTISQVTLTQSALDQELTEDEVYEKMLSMYRVMQQSVEDGLDKNLKTTSGLAGGWASKVKARVNENKNISGSFLGHVLSNALAVSELNAAMGQIVAAPTAGSCGVIPGCLTALQSYNNLTDKQIVMGLLNASAIGMVIAKNASISGAEGGCQAEIGTSVAMASSAMTEIMGGTPESCGHAIAQSIKSLMGLSCDPVAGLVEEPCIVRNATGASIAVASTELSLAGIKSIVPVDEVILTAHHIGKGLPEALRETSEGGLAITPTGKKIKACFDCN